MARLTDGFLTLEIKYREIDDLDWLQYDIWLWWDGEPLINPAILKRVNPYWDDRRDNAFRVCELQEDSLLPVLEEFLRTYTPSEWEPIEPDFNIQLNAMVSDPWHRTERHQGLPNEAIVLDDEGAFMRLRPEYMQPDDWIEVKVGVDYYNLRGEIACGNRVEVGLIAQRKSLEAFLLELKEEYEECLQRTQPKRLKEAVEQGDEEI